MAITSVRRSLARPAGVVPRTAGPARPFVATACARRTRVSHVTTVRRTADSARRRVVTVNATSGTTRTASPVPTTVAGAKVNAARITARQVAKTRRFRPVSAKWTTTAAACSGTVFAPMKSRTSVAGSVSNRGAAMTGVVPMRTVRPARRIVASAAATGNVRSGSVRLATTVPLTAVRVRVRIPAAWCTRRPDVRTRRWKSVSVP